MSANRSAATLAYCGMGYSPLQERQVILELPVSYRSGELRPLGPFDCHELSYQFRSYRLDKLLISLKRIQSTVQIIRYMLVCALVLEAILLFRRRWREFIHDTQPRRLHDGRRSEVRVHRPVCHAVLQPGGAAAIVGDAQRNTAMVVSPVGPVARELCRTQALVGIHGGCAKRCHTGVMSNDSCDALICDAGESVRITRIG